MPGSLFEHNDKVYVLKGTDRSRATKNGRQPRYYIDINGNRHLYNKCKVIKNNGGIIYVGNQQTYRCKQQ